MIDQAQRLSDLCIGDIEKIKPEKEPDKTFWYIDISSVDNIEKKIVSPTLTIGRSASVRARQIVRKNDVLVSTTRPNLNAVALVGEKYNGEICSTGFCVLRCDSELDPEYLFFFVRSNLFVESLSNLVQGALYPAVTNKQVLMQLIPWPPISLQREIAAKAKEQLAELDKARKAMEIQLRDVCLLESRILYNIFNGLDSMPKDKIGEMAETKSGSTPARSDKRYWESAEIPWVKTGEVAYIPISKTEECISRVALDECPMKLLPPKTVLVAMYGQGKTRGQSAILEVEAATNQACFAILPNDTWEPEFLYLWLKRSYNDLRELSNNRGGNQANLNGGLLNAFKVPTIPKNEQREIVKKINTALQEVGRIKKSCEASLSEINAMPGRILTRAFEM